MDEKLIDFITTAAPIIVAFVMSIPGLLNYFRTKRRDKVEGVAVIKASEKSEADATGVIVTAATSLIEPYIERVKLLEARDSMRAKDLDILTVRVSIIERNNYILCDGVRRLIMQIMSLGATPVFEIDESLCNEMANGGSVDGIQEN